MTTKPAPVSAYLQELAAKIKAGEDLGAMGRAFAAHAVEKLAAELPDKLPQPKGAAPQFNHADAALEFLALTCNPHNRKSRTAAIEALAEKYGVSIEAMGNPPTG